MALRVHVEQVHAGAVASQRPLRRDRPPRRTYPVRPRRSSRATSATPPRARSSWFRRRAFRGHARRRARSGASTTWTSSWPHASRRRPRATAALAPRRPLDEAALAALTDAAALGMGGTRSGIVRGDILPDLRGSVATTWGHRRGRRRLRANARGRQLEAARPERAAAQEEAVSARKQLVPGVHKGKHCAHTCGVRGKAAEAAAVARAAEAAAAAAGGRRRQAPPRRSSPAEFTTSAERGQAWTACLQASG